MTQESPSDISAGQPAKSQAPVSVRPPERTTGQTARKKNVPGGQRRASDQLGTKPKPTQKLPGKKQSKTPTTAPSASRASLPTQQPTSKKQSRKSAASVSRRATLETKQLLLGLAGGLVGGMVGAIVFGLLFPQAVTFQQSKTYFVGPPALLSVLVGLGVRFGARRQHIVLALLAGLLGLVSLLLAFNFGLSLVYAQTFGLGTNLFALPLGRIFDSLKILLQQDPAFSGYFVFVPIIAGFIGLGRPLRWSRRR